jgi:hypothetical protein
MANLNLLYRNLSDPAILSGGSWQLPLTNAQDPDIGIVARSTNAQNSSTKLKADLGSILAVGGIVLGPINATPGSQYRVRSYSDSALTVVVSDSGTKTFAGTSIDWTSTVNWLEWEDPGFWTGIPNADEIEDGTPLYLFEVFSVDVTAQYWQVEIFDSANADGYVQFGRLMIAKAWRPDPNYSEDDNQVGFDFVTDKQETLGLLTNYWERGMRRTMRVSFPHVELADLFGTVYNIAVRSGISRQVFVIPDPSDAVNARKRCWLATFQTASALAQREVDRGQTAMDLIEVT